VFFHPRATNIRGTHLAEVWAGEATGGREAWVMLGRRHPPRHRAERPVTVERI
jgi:hypothetical protein